MSLASDLTNELESILSKVFAFAAVPVQDPDDPVVFWFSVGTLAAGIVPDEILLAFKLVRDAPDPLNVVAVQVPVTVAPVD